MRRRIHRALHRAETHVDRLRHRLKRRFGRVGKISIEAYDGYGTPDRLRFSGRVLENRVLDAPDSSSSKWRNFYNAYRRFETDEIPNVRVRASLRGHSYIQTTDEEGYFAFDIELQEGLRPEESWHEVPLALAEPGYGEATAKARVRLPGESPEFFVASDIDDTVLRSEATDFFRMVALAFLHNAATRTAFPGVAEFYQALRRGPSGEGDNPIFYVSSSPWNFFDLLRDFFRMQGLPVGPFLLRDIGLSERSFIVGNHRHKLEKIVRLLETYSHLPCVLIGDSGQQDPVLYAEVARTYPTRILAIYIRDVSLAGRERVERIAAELRTEGLEMTLVPDSAGAARHAAEHGLIRYEDIAAVQQASARRQA